MTHKHRLQHHHKHPVSDHFADHIVKVFGSIPEERDAIRMRDAIFRKSSASPYSITEEDRENLKAATSVLNMHRAAEALGDRPLDEIFGPGSTICQVHGNAVHHPCGCVTHHFFDHHKRHEPDIKTVPHRPIRVCANHKELAADFKVHYAHLHKPE